MKGKRYRTEEKIRILREADRGEKSIQAICQEQNISEVTSTGGSGSLGRWRSKRPGASVSSRANGCGGWDVLRASRLPVFGIIAFDVWGFKAPANPCGCTVKETAARTVAGASALRIAADRGAVATGGLAGGQTADWRAEGLRVPPTKRKVVRRGISTGFPTRARTESRLRQDMKKDLKQTPNAVRALCSRQPRFPAGRLCAVTGGHCRTAVAPPKNAIYSGCPTN